MLVTDRLLNNVGHRQYCGAVRMGNHRQTHFDELHTILERTGRSVTGEKVLNSLVTLIKTKYQRLTVICSYAGPDGNGT